MDFSITQKTLERLEWPRIAARLAGAARTPRGRASLSPAPEQGAAAGFAPSLEAVLERHAETAEALAILADGEAPPLGGVGEVSGLLARARKGGSLPGEALLELRGTLAALRETASFFEARREEAPRLAELAAAVRPQAALERRIEAAIEPSGEVRDSASPELAQARRESRSATAEIQQRLERLLQDPDLRARLSDDYFTIRNDRYVLPVRAEAKGGVRGILHDASRSGTTVFVEPEALVEINNRLRQSGLAAAREALRVLGELSAAAGAAADEIETGISALAGIDRAFARAALAQELRATRPEVGEPGRGARLRAAPPAASGGGSRRQRREPRRGLPACSCSPGRTPAARRSRSSPSRSRRSACERACSCRRSRARASTSSTPYSQTSATSRTSARASRPSPRTWRISRASSRRRARARWSCSTRSAPAPTRSKAPRSRRRASRRSPTAGRA